MIPCFVFDARQNKGPASFGTLVARAAVLSMNRPHAGECQIERQIPAQSDHISLGEGGKRGDDRDLELQCLARHLLKPNEEIGGAVRNRTRRADHQPSGLLDAEIAPPFCWKLS